MYRSPDTSCKISSIGNSGSRSAGPIGCLVPGCKTGGRGFGRSAVKLYQVFGMCVSSKTNLTWSLTQLSLAKSNSIELEATYMIHESVEVVNSASLSGQRGMLNRKTATPNDPRDRK